MNPAMRSAFPVGIGHRPLVLKSTLGLIAVALIPWSPAGSWCSSSTPTATTG